MKEDPGQPDTGPPPEVSPGTQRGPAPSSARNSSVDHGADAVFYCDLCGNVMLNLHCKLVCERCGYKRDCSDP